MRPRGVGFRIVIVLGGLGIVWFLVHPNRMVNVFRQHASAARSGLWVLAAGIESYALDHGGRYPTTIADLLAGQGSTTGYLAGRATAPRDPWNREFRLEVSPLGDWFRVGSLGRDGEPGGSGDDADLWLDSRAAR